MKKISGYFKDKIDLLTEEFNSFDLNKKGTISFIALKKIVEKLKINLKKEILEYMIFFMKKFCINNENSIFRLFEIANVYIRKSFYCF